jgi:hypothetical protein
MKPSERQFILCTGVFMKRIAVITFLVLLTTGVFAQGPSPRFQDQMPEKTTITGSLGIVNGRISLASGGTTYFPMGLNRWIGFIDGLKEGAAVNIEGYAKPSLGDNAALFYVTKLTIGGKSYDLSPTDTGRNRLSRPEEGPRLRGKGVPAPGTGPFCAGRDTRRYNHGMKRPHRR